MQSREEKTAMSNKEHLIEQHVREYESRLRHIDELYQRAHEVTEHLESDDSTRHELKQLGQQRDQLEEQTEKVKELSLDELQHQIELKAGPMAIWDVLARKLEEFVERHE